jgi:DNA polymerase-3 subunit alpha (Gram-positive type)
VTLPVLDSVLADCPIVVIDTETTGRARETALPVELGLARFERGELVATWSTLLNPGMPIPKEVIAIHGITDDQVKDAPPATGNLLELVPAELLEGAYPCGYNAMHYDRPILRRLAGDRADDHAHLAALWADPLVWIRDLDGIVKGQHGRHRLGNTCGRWKIERGEQHRAIGDCISTGRLLWAMRDKLPETLEPLIKLQEMRRRAQEADLARYWGRGRVHR